MVKECSLWAKFSLTPPSWTTSKLHGCHHMVQSNAVVLQSKYPEATIVVDAACTDSFDKDLHEKVLDVLAGFQVKVTNR